MFNDLFYKERNKVHQRGLKARQEERERVKKVKELVHSKHPILKELLVSIPDPEQE